MKALITTRHLIVTACSAVAMVAATSVAALPAPSTALAACPNGEDNDTYTQNCVPYLVPNSPSGNNLCPPGVSGTECGSAEIQTTPTAPIAPTGPEQELEDVSTPDF
ncbi:hypothetical protein [Mycolicibacterium nivoides]|uniref:Intersectin-EH binding protein Ibp1 n=1 Tax=Mycolicibacterium nivoides TaxID=2487344 RepID=A0ABW9L808_9MYCO|nr:hypothetical protein [Mycolicibacterium nivoides]MBN3510093.1 hypothetical protein [Mycolicibacterium septicum]QRY45720.1 hypothetical protein JVX93_02025 [Mycolicibacterium boenickei]SEQ71474.1 hypothetical protein SAMN04488583_3286 [Mycobacterium sp. 88mf]SFF62919.1 hypothetical protein SAMN04488582_103415 [Mycobacterium sp. 455mf]